MFPRSNRLQETKDILTVLRKGQRRTTPVVAATFLAKTGTVPRVTVIIDKKTAKLATARNKAKRRTRAALREVGLPQGDLVVRIQKGAAAQSFQVMKQAIEVCLSKK